MTSRQSLSFSDGRLPLDPPPQGPVALCTRCHGFGFVAFHSPDGPTETTCPDCRGVGWIEDDDDDCR